MEKCGAEKREDESGLFQALRVIAVTSVMPDVFHAPLGSFPLMGFVPAKRTVCYLGIVFHMNREESGYSRYFVVLSLSLAAGAQADGRSQRPPL